MKHRSYGFRTLLLSLIYSLVLPAQPICRIRHYSVSDGLSQSFVQRICQAPNGLLWFGTWNGLNSYDGYTFTNYNMSSPGGAALSTNRLTDIQIGTDGDVWCQTYDGRVFLFLTREQTFVDVLEVMEAELRHKVTVTSVQVLPKGVVWIVCKNGYAFRLDERRFKHEQERPTLYSTYNHTLKGGHVFRVYEDSEGDEWVLTDKGVNIIGRKHVVSDYPFDHIKEWGGNIYLVTVSNKLAKYHPRSGDFDFLDITDDAGDIQSMQGLGQDNLLLQAPDALTLYDCCHQSGHTVRIKDFARHSHAITNVYKDKEGYCWILLDGNEMLRLNPHTFEMRLYPLPPIEVNHHDRKNHSVVFTDPNRTLWAIPERGVMCYYDAGQDAFLPYLRNELDASSFYTPFIRYSAFDAQGNLWYAPNTGLEKVSFLSHFFNLHRMEEEMDIRVFLKDRDERLWVGSQNGIVRIYPKDSREALYLSPQGTLTRHKCTFTSGAYALRQDSCGSIWLGTKEDGLYRLTPTAADRFLVRHYLHEKDDPYSLSSNSVYALCRDNRGHLWVGTFGGGLNLVSEEEDGRIRFVHHRNELKSYPAEYTNRIRSLTETDKGILLVGTTDGLLACNTDFNRPEEIKFYHHKHRMNDATSLTGNDIMGVFAWGGVKSEETVFVLSFTGGMSKIAPDSLLSEGAAFRHYTSQNGLISNLVHSMTQDRKGRFWVVTEHGLSRFDPRTERFVNYRSDRFYPNLKFAETIPLLLDDRLLLGTNLGVLELNLSDLPHNTYVPPVLFTEVRLQGRLLNRDVNQLKELVVLPHQRNISFRFSAVEFVNPAGIQYAYRLKGLETEWNEVGNTRSASYMNLPAGNYTLEVRSTNSDGVWMDNIHSLRLTVKPTFSETGWAWVLYAGLFILLVGTVCYVLFYIYRLRHRIDVEQHLADIKLRFFTDISHELRTPLTLISSPVDEVLQNEPLTEKGRENLTLVRTNTRRMLRMMNQILDFRKMQNHKMKLLVEETDLLQLLRQVMEHFRAMAQSKDITFRLDASVPSLRMWLDVDKIEKVFFNLISNAFKYSPDHKAITVEARQTGHEVQVTVADQGVGIDAAHRRMLFRRFENFAHGDMLQPSSGIGLSLVKDMVELHHGHIEVESRPGEGSRFTVSLPRDKAAYEEDKLVEFILNDSPAVRESAPAGQEETAEADKAPDGERLTILLVEDNDELRLFLRNILATNYRVLEATNGEQGLAQALGLMPDLIITDVMMPVMDGLDMVKHLKDNRMVCHIPVIMLSAKSSLDDRINGLEQGIDDYIVKPFSATYLKTRITSLLRQRRQLQELYMNRLAEQAPPGHAPSQPQPGIGYEPAMPELQSLDDQFMKQVMEFLEANMGNQELEIENMAEHLYMSRTVFYRKLKSITGLTPVEFVREVRIKRAIQLMESDGYTISQIAYMTGFRDPKYFSKVFKKATGLTPSEYKERKDADD